MQKLVVILGTNASGKSDLGIRLAKYFGGEVVSADSRQVYRGLDLGSGKITPAQAGTVKHHLIDVADVAELIAEATLAIQMEATAEDIAAILAADVVGYSHLVEMDEAGTLAALKMGLATIRRECPHFKDWLERLETWPQQHGTQTTT